MITTQPNVAKLSVIINHFFHFFLNLISSLLPPLSSLVSFFPLLKGFLFLSFKFFKIFVNLSSFGFTSAEGMADSSSGNFYSGGMKKVTRFGSIESCEMFVESGVLIMPLIFEGVQFIQSFSYAYQIMSSMILVQLSLTIQVLLQVSFVHSLGPGSQIALYSIFIGTSFTYSLEGAQIILVQFAAFWEFYNQAGSGSWQYQCQEKTSIFFWSQQRSVAKLDDSSSLLYCNFYEIEIFYCAYTQLDFTYSFTPTRGTPTQQIGKSVYQFYGLQSQLGKMCLISLRENLFLFLLHGDRNEIVLLFDTAENCGDKNCSFCRKGTQLRFWLQLQSGDVSNTLFMDPNKQINQQQ